MYRGLIACSSSKCMYSLDEELSVVHHFRIYTSGLHYLLFFGTQNGLADTCIYINMIMYETRRDAKI